MKEKKKTNESSLEEKKALKHYAIIITPRKSIRIEEVDPKETPLPYKYALELEGLPNPAIAWLVVQNPLKPAVEHPLIERMIEENKYIPVDVENISKYEIAEFKQKVYDALELISVGKWKREVFEKETEMKPAWWQNIPWWVIVLAIALGVGIFLAITFFSGGSVSVTHTATPKPVK